jgi:effector-binding domain-containing protein
MEIKQVKQTKVFGKEIKTSLKTIGEHVKVLPESVFNEMQKKNIEPNGAQVWIYNGSDGNPETVFDLLVGYPVDSDKMDVNITALDDFKCASHIHNGNWSEFKNVYEQLVGEVMQNGLTMTGECREIYHEVDFDNVENNITEIQIGVK